MCRLRTRHAGRHYYDDDTACDDERPPLNRSRCMDCRRNEPAIGQELCYACEAREERRRRDDNSRGFP